MYQYPYGNAQQLNLDWLLSKIQELEAGSGGGADLEEVANALVSASFDSGVSYRRYDYCFYNGKLYRALNDNIGAFNPSDWMEVTLGADIPVLTRLVNADSALITTLQNQLQNLGSDEVANESTVTGTTVSDALGNLNGAINDNAQTYLVADTTWEQGSISGTGAETESTTRIRTKNYIPVANALSVSGVINSGYMFGIAWYDSSKTFISDNGWYNTTAKVDKPSNAAYCRITFAFSNSATITPSESSHIEVRIDMTVKNAIDTVNDKAKYDIYDEGIYVYNNPILAAYTTGSGNYIDFFMPIKVNTDLTIAATYERSYRHEGDSGDTHTAAYLLDAKIDATVAMNANIAILKKTESGITFEIGFTNTQTPAKPATIVIARLVITATR